MQPFVLYGARSRNRTGTPLRAGDFKSHASTSFAIRAVARSASWKRRIRGSDRIEAGAAEGRNIYIPPQRSKVAHVLFKTKASLPHKEKSSVNHRSTELFYSGGRSRNRTGVGGFAIHCITILLFGLKRLMQSHHINRVLTWSEENRLLSAISLKTLRFFTTQRIRWAQLCTHLPKLTTP